MTILCYHTFDAGPHSPFSLPRRRFDEQMRYLYVQKIPVIPMSALIDHLEKKTPLPERSVVITIDDGYKTAKEIAWPILQRYGHPFTLYVYPHAISRLKASLTWPDLRQMAAQGVEIQSHSLTHPLLTHPGKSMNKKEYGEWIDQELVESKRRIEAELKRPVTSLAFPYGGYDEGIVAHARAAGYRAALTCEDGDVSAWTDPLLLNRRLVFRQTTFKSFVQLLTVKPLQMADLSPRDGERVKDIPKEIRARLVNFEQIQPGSAQVLVDKLGRHWAPIPIDPKTGWMSIPVPSKVTRRGFYFVNLTAKDRLNPTLKREASWLFIVGRNTSKK